MGYKIDSDILFGLIHSELKTVLSPLNSLISDDRICHFEIAIGGIIKKAGELTDAEANSSEKPNDSDTISRRATIDEVQAIEHLATLRDGDVVVRMNDVEHILYTMPSAQPERTPCDCCKYNPPSSFDGKPCTICPAVGRGESDE